MLPTIFYKSIVLNFLLSEVQTISKSDSFVFWANSDHMIYVHGCFMKWFMCNSWVDHEWVPGAVSAGSKIQRPENHQNSNFFEYFWLAGQRPGTRSRIGIWRQLDWHPAHERQPLQHRAHKREKSSSQSQKQKRFDMAR